MSTTKGPIATETLLQNGNLADKNGTITQVKAVEVNEPHPPTKPAFELEEHPIDEVRQIKVGVIGAGLSGITAGVLLPAKLPGLDLRIYDKNADVGGTW
jgi:ribulose 1,5-bisphosphate synthetase/thiazole synthase